MLPNAMNQSMSTVLLRYTCPGGPMVRKVTLTNRLKYKKVLFVGLINHFEIGSN